MSQELVTEDELKFPDKIPQNLVFADSPQRIQELKNKIKLDQLLDESELAQYISNLLSPRNSAKRVRLAYYWGDRGGGKTTGMEQDAEDYYNEFLNCWWLWGSRSNENVFIAVNRNCRRKWDKARLELEKAMMLARNDIEREKIAEIYDTLDERIHCDCHKAYPINWLVPDYYKFDMASVEAYNFNWKNKAEYDEAWEAQWVTRPYAELSRVEKELLAKKKLRKPDHLLPKDHNGNTVDLIRICPFKVPISAADKVVFEKQFLKYALEARKEHRWVIMNPLMFAREIDKFATSGFIFERIKVWVDQYFQPLTEEIVAKMRGVEEPVPEEKWSKQEKSWDKILLVLAELRTIAPPHKYSPEKESSRSKRPIIDMIPELRHFRVWLMGDLQAPDDLNDSVRPMADYVVIKRATKDLLGQEWTHFINTINSLRKEMLLKLSKGRFEEFKDAPPQFKKIVDKNLPMVEELPKNKGYIVYRNGEFYLENFGQSSFHHKKETETIQSVTGITWKIDHEKAGTNNEIADNSEKSIKNTQKSTEDVEYEKAQTFLAKHFVLLKSWDLAQKAYSLEIKEGRMTATGLEALDSGVLSNNIRRNKKIREKLDFCKKNKKLSKEDLAKQFE